jgi:hypothetical protein
MKSIGLLLLSLSLTLPCFGMGQTLQRANSWISQYILKAKNKLYPSNQSIHIQQPVSEEFVQRNMQLIKQIEDQKQNQIIPEDQKFKQEVRRAWLNNTISRNTRDKLPDQIENQQHLLKNFANLELTPTVANDLKLRQALAEDLILRNASNKLAKEIQNQHKIKANAEKRYLKKSWYQWLFKKQSSFDKRRQETAWQEREAAQTKANALVKGYENVQSRRLTLKRHTDESFPGQTLIKKPSLNFEKLIYKGK